MYQGLQGTKNRPSWIGWVGPDSTRHFLALGLSMMILVDNLSEHANTIA